MTWGSFYVPLGLSPPLSLFPSASCSHGGHQNQTRVGRCYLDHSMLAQASLIHPTAPDVIISCQAPKPSGSSVPAQWDDSTPGSQLSAPHGLEDVVEI